MSEESLKICEVYEGHFEPKVLDTLDEKAKPYIGKKMQFEALWRITEEDGGPYVGQWALRALRKNSSEWLPIGWIPQEDIRFVDDKLNSEK